MADGDRIDQMIKEVAARHGVALGRDDPILMLLTMHERLQRDAEASQRALLAEFKSELEVMTQRVTSEAKAQASGALQATLKAGQDALTHAVGESTASVTESVRAQIDNSARQVAAQLQHARRVGTMVLGGSLVVLLAGLVVAWAGR
jgi:hypothetical protein